MCLNLLPELDDVIATQARTHGASYVDFAAANVGHDTCAAPTDRYWEGLVPAAPAAPERPGHGGIRRNRRRHRRR